nr:MAG TPA: hypothetical protein [Caudoviricetes sp.]
MGVFVFLHIVFSLLIFESGCMENLRFGFL